MMRAIGTVLFLALLSPTFGFGVVGSLKTRTLAHPTISFQEKTSWSEYKHDYVDPITPHAIESNVKAHMDPAKRAIADEYWLMQFEKEKEKLHQHMMVETSTEVPLKESETYAHYKHEYIDPITPHETASKVTNHMDPAKREIADKYWLQRFLNDKKNLHRAGQS